jgi:hypothetical protein
MPSRLEISYRYFTRPSSKSILALARWLVMAAAVVAVDGVVVVVAVEEVVVVVVVVCIHK